MSQTKIFQIDSENNLDHNSVKTEHEWKLHKVVLCGGPCAGKTTAQSRLKSFFEEIGWKVFTVPETATILLTSGIKFSELDKKERLLFQKNILKTMLQIEDSINTVAEQFYEKKHQNTLIIYDRGTMDTKAFLTNDEWEEIIKDQPNWNDIDLRDNRYNQVVYLQTAADGAEKYYGTATHSCRSENIGLARDLDKLALSAWIGHPYLDMILNERNRVGTNTFEEKMMNVLNIISDRIGIDKKNRLDISSKKRKLMLLGNPIMDDLKYTEFSVIHDYLTCLLKNTRIRLRKRGLDKNWCYTQTTELREKKVETKRRLTRREYEQLLLQRDIERQTIVKTRRCFIWENKYYHLDIFHQPKQCEGLVFLETYTKDEGRIQLPAQFSVVREITGDSEFSMYNMASRKNHKEQYSRHSSEILLAEMALTKPEFSTENGNGNVNNSQEESVVKFDNRSSTASLNSNDDSGVESIDKQKK
ncbi:hypothetical protein SNEBB_003130 [Seison nebaliae]|nr:hypothetical protein SNEBB_003130 [Seison nebaliae]